jgi:hypothetical protein
LDRNQVLRFGGSSGKPDCREDYIRRRDFFAETTVGLGGTQHSDAKFPVPLFLSRTTAGGDIAGFSSTKSSESRDQEIDQVLRDRKGCGKSETGAKSEKTDVSGIVSILEQI